MVYTSDSHDAMTVLSNDSLNEQDNTEDNPESLTNTMIQGKLH